MNQFEKDHLNNSRPTPHQAASDEIDLGLVIKKIRRGFQNLGRKLSYIGDLIVRRIVLVVSTVLLICTLAYLLYRNTPPLYASEMIVSVNNYRNDFCEELIDRLDLAIRDGNFENVSQKLRIDLATARSLSGLSYGLVNERPVMEDSILTGEPFVIKVETFNRQAFDTLQSGILHYLENNEYFTTVKKIRRHRLEELIQRYEKELVLIDSVKMQANNYSGLPNSNGILLGQPDPVNMFREGSSFFNKKLEAMAELVLINNFHVISPFTPRAKPESPVWYTHLLWGFFGGLALSVIIGINLDKREKKKQLQTA